MFHTKFPLRLLKTLYTYSTQLILRTNHRVSSMDGLLTWRIHLHVIYSTMPLNLDKSQ